MADKTCKYFDPSKDLAAQGLVSGDLYPYDSHLGWESCWSPERGAATNNWVTCDFANQSECPCYAPEKLVRTDFVRVVTNDQYVFFVLGHFRVQRGVGQYKIYTWSSTDADALTPPPDVVVSANWNSIDHGVNAKNEAKAGLEELVTKASGGDPTKVTRLPITSAEHKATRSYLETVTQG